MRIEIFAMESDMEKYQITRQYKRELIGKNSVFLIAGFVAVVQISPWLFFPYFFFFLTGIALGGIFWSIHYSETLVLLGERRTDAKNLTSNFVFLQVKPILL